MMPKPEPKTLKSLERSLSQSLAELTIRTIFSDGREGSFTTEEFGRVFEDLIVIPALRYKWTRAVGDVKLRRWRKQLSCMICVLPSGPDKWRRTEKFIRACFRRGVGVY